MFLRAAVFAVALLLLAAPAHAEEPDSVTRFHDAYVLEVIDGRIAEAAKAYLALMDDERLTTRIREKARFRFAICTVLLGRPDEGRMQLAAISENERAPASLRKQAQAYLESISALGVGTELERKLQALVFDLGRSEPGALSVAAYRDFEIIGTPAIPFLERMLQHEDAKLRQHAFRLLIRLGAEDLVARWHPGIQFAGQPYCLEVERYLTARPEELAALETKLLALDDETLEKALLRFAPWPTWSLDFVRALAGRSEGLQRDAFVYLDRAGDEAARWAFARDCILGDEGALRFASSRWAVGQSGGPPDALAGVLWLPVVRHAATLGGQWLPSRGWGENLVAWAQRLPTDRLLEALSELNGLGEQAVAAQRANPLGKHQPAGLVAYVLKERDLSTEQLDLYEERVRHWTLVIAPTLEGEMSHNDVNPVAKPLRDVVQRLPADRAASHVGWLFGGPAHELPNWFEDVVRIERPEDVPLLVEAVRRVRPDRRGILLHLVPKVNATWPSVEIAQAVVDALPTLLGLSSVEEVNDHRPGQRGFWGSVCQLTGRVPDESLATSTRRLFETAVGGDEDEPKALFVRLVSFSAQTGAGIRKKGAFFARFVLPAVDAQYERLTASFRSHVMQQALLPLQHAYGLAQRDRAGLAAYVLAHLDDVPNHRWHALAAYPDLFPLERWLAAVPADLISARHDIPLRREQVDAAMPVLAADIAKLDDVVLQVLVGYASPEVATEIVDRMLASEDAAIRHRAIEKIRGRSGYPGSPAGLESALAGLLAEEQPDLGDLARVALLLSTIQPSERLIPAADRLLASDEPKVLLEGISLAKRLGREELVPALARLLTSLDANLRDRAKAAIQSIEELKRLQQEAGGER